MSIRLSETKLNQLVKELSAWQYKEVRLKLSLNGTKESCSDKLDNVVQVFRNESVSSKDEVLERTGCTDGTYRSYKTRFVNAILTVLADSATGEIHEYLRDIQRAQVLYELGEHRSAFDLADSVLTNSLTDDSGAIARLALDVMSSSAQEAYPEEATTKLTEVGKEMFGIAGKFFSMTGLYQLYTQVRSKSDNTLLLCAPQEFAEWRAWEQRANMHEQKKDFPPHYWIYLALSKCAIHELKGETNEAFEWYDRLWQKLHSNKSKKGSGRLGFDARFERYILLALKSGNIQKAKEANKLFKASVSEHPSLEVQHSAIQAFFDLQTQSRGKKNASAEDDFSSFVDKMIASKRGEAYYHRDWSPYVRNQVYQGLFNACFTQHDFTSCRLILSWADDRSNKSETVSDFTQIVPLLRLIIMFEQCKTNNRLVFSEVDSSIESPSKSAYDRFRRKRDLFPIETEVALFLYKLNRADTSSLLKLKAETLQKLSVLEKSSFYYPNLMNCFHLEHWISSLDASECGKIGSNKKGDQPVAL